MLHNKVEVFCLFDGLIWQMEVESISFHAEIIISIEGTYAFGSSSKEPVLEYR